MTLDPDLPRLWTHEPHVHLQFRAGQKVDDIDTDATPGFRGSKSDAPALQDERNIRFAELQEMLYANSRSGDTRSVLLILQGMDTAGKGGIVKHVVGAGNPQGIRYTSFGKPTEDELAHHYLWRIRNALPPAGHIGVFDRSHYEDVLIGRVRELAPPEEIERRYGAINEFEAELVDEGTTIVKVMLHISAAEQKVRLLDRLDRPEKQWKFNPGDIEERMLWPKYQDAYQVLFDRTSTPIAPWYVVPADRKWYARLAVQHLIIDALEAMDLQWPGVEYDVEAEKARLLAAT